METVPIERARNNPIPNGLLNTAEAWADEVGPSLVEGSSVVS